jgi:hypothetical protein
MLKIFINVIDTHPTGLEIVREEVLRLRYSNRLKSAVGGRHELATCEDPCVARLLKSRFNKVKTRNVYG